MKEQTNRALKMAKEFVKINRKEIILIAFLLIVSGVAHGYNMFSFPYYENDEGVYMSQAWSVLTQGKMAPYTYWYDHSPAGWLFIAIWAKLTGGFYIFGMTLNTGRVFMLVLHLFSTFFLYKIAKKMTSSNYAGFFAALIFALSPLGIYFQRRVLLDNIMVFWILFSLYVLLCHRKRLLTIIISAIAFALSCLSKESAVFFMPVLLYLVFLEIDKRHRKMGIVLWLVSFGVVCSFYPLYALLKGELFPMGSMFDSGGKHVSLIGTLMWQALRKGGSIGTLMWQWINSDKVLIILGSISVCLGLFLGIKKKYYRISALLALFYLFYLVRGGMIIEFYIIGVIPFIALNIGIIISFILSKINNVKVRRGVALGLLGILSFCFIDEAKHIKGSSVDNNIYYSNQTVSQLEALAWTKNNISSDKVIIIDNYGYIELKDPNVFAISYKNAQWYWKVLQDPEIRDYALNNDWQNIDYIMTTPQMEFDVSTSGSVIFQDAYKNSRPVKSFWSNGWGVTVWKTYNPRQILQDSWKSYKANFITAEGRVFDPEKNNSTTSEGQSYALLRAVWLDDKVSFDRTLAWTNKNLKLKSNNLFVWSWIQDEKGNWRIKDKGTASDADQDIALALLFAYKQWGGQVYLDQSCAIIKDIWKYEVVVIQGKAYLTAGNWTSGKNDIVINPSYFSPFAYRIFAEVDPEHDWQGVIDTSYDVLSHSSKTLLGSESTLGLPPNWLAINPNGEFISASHLGDFSTGYSYDAIRIPWRVALDWEWNKEPRAKTYLESLTFLGDKWTQEKKIMASYSHDGKYFDNYEAIESYGGSMGYFKVVNPEAGKEVYEEKLFSKYFEDENNSYWDDPMNYYKQNWGWFGTAIYANKLPNLWNK